MPREPFFIHGKDLAYKKKKSLTLSLGLPPFAAHINNGSNTVYTYCELFFALALQVIKYSETYLKILTCYI